MLRRLGHGVAHVFFRLLVRVVYRVRVEGAMPATGGALLVCNHLSFADPFLLTASTSRRIRFLVYDGLYRKRPVHLLAWLVRAIPIAPEQRRRDMVRALQTARQAIRNGEVVCVFAEGEMSRIGRMLPFRRGLETIVRGLDTPIVPVHLDGIWGSIFSFERGRYFWKMPRHLRRRVTVSYGAAMPPTSTAASVRQAVQELQADAWLRRSHIETLPRAFVRTARRHPLRMALMDAGTTLRCGQALVRALHLARRLAPAWQGQGAVGILLPASAESALVNVAALLCGRTPVNLNYTLSNESIASCARQCSVETVITSKAFLERSQVRVPGRTVLLDDIAAAPTPAERLTAFALAWICPVSLIARVLHSRNSSLDDPATVLFSSGMTGEPRGVTLTHRNIAASAVQLGECLGLSGRDRLLGVLPFFHTSGFTATLALPLTMGVGVAYHDDPFDARAAGVLAAAHGASCLMATPALLQRYADRCTSLQFASLRLVLTVGHMGQERAARSFQERFGIQPLETYGCTECGGVIAVNRPDFRAPGFHQVGTKRGTVGHPLPGVSVRIVDPDSRRPMRPGEPGLLLVRGPNVMKGYLGRPAETAQAIDDEGWFATGDLASQDEDGFLTITGRLGRPATRDARSLSASS